MTAPTFGKRGTTGTTMPFPPSASAMPSAKSHSHGALYTIEISFFQAWVLPLLIEIPLAFATLYVLLSSWFDPAFLQLEQPIVDNRRGWIINEPYQYFADLPWWAQSALLAGIMAFFLKDAFFRIHLKISGEPMFKMTEDGVSGYRFWKVKEIKWHELAEVRETVVENWMASRRILHLKGSGSSAGYLNVPTASAAELDLVKRVVLTAAGHLQGQSKRTTVPVY